MTNSHEDLHVAAGARRGEPAGRAHPRLAGTPAGASPKSSRRDADPGGGWVHARSAMRLVPFAAGAAALLSARLVLADAPTFSWTRGADAAMCPSRAVVLRDLEAALGAPLDARLQGRALEVTVHRDDASWRATLWWRDPTGALLGTRQLQVTAADCEALLRATRASVVIALNSGVFEGDGEPDRPPAPPPARAARQGPRASSPPPRSSPPAAGSARPRWPKPSPTAEASPRGSR